MTDRALRVLILLAYAWCGLLLIFLNDYHSRIEHCGDNPSYAREVDRLTGRSKPGDTARHFLGYSLSALPLALMGMDVYTALAVVSVLAGVVAIVIVARLWGWWVAAYFSLTNFDWVQRTLLGGAEPLFAALIFLAFLAARRERWMLAALLGSLSTVVRPLGIFFLLAMGIQLLRVRRLGTLALAIGISLTLGGCYFMVVKQRFGDPAANFEWYRSMGLGKDPNFIPFVTVFASYARHLITAKNLVKTLVWTSCTFLALIAAVGRLEIRQSLRLRPVEWMFAMFYLASFLFFPAWWMEGEYPRYLVPVIPLIFVALRPWLTEKRQILWIGGLLSVTLAAVEDMPWFSEVLRWP